MIMNIEVVCEICIHIWHLVFNIQNSEIPLQHIIKLVECCLLRTDPKLFGFIHCSLEFATTSGSFFKLDGEEESSSSSDLATF